MSSNPWADPQSRSILGFYHLHHRSTGVENSGIYFLDPPNPGTLKESLVGPSKGLDPIVINTRAPYSEYNHHILHILNITTYHTLHILNIATVSSYTSNIPDQIKETRQAKGELLEPSNFKFSGILSRGYGALYLDAR